ncbi:MAG: hypothetical protein R2771_09305 [Saprospiraceae bacterium]
MEREEFWTDEFWDCYCWLCFCTDEYNLKEAWRKGNNFARNIDNWWRDMIGAFNVK